MKKRLVTYLAIVLAAVALTGVAVVLLHPGLGTRLGRMLTGQPPVSGLDVKVPRRQFPVKGIDVSHHNGRINYAAVAADSVDFVIIKATEGVNFRDSMMVSNMRGARAAGLQTGFYHFFRFDRGGVRQGRHFLGTVDTLPSDFPLVIDFETAHNPPTDYYLVVGRLRDMVSFLRRRGRRVMVYCNHDGYETYIRGNFDDLDLWLASGRVPTGTDRRTLWQHTHNGRVNGITTPVDINTFNGTRSQFHQWLSRPPLEPLLPAPHKNATDTIKDTCARYSIDIIQES